MDIQYTKIVFSVPKNKSTPQRVKIPIVQMGETNNVEHRKEKWHPNRDVFSVYFSQTGGRPCRTTPNFFFILASPLFLFFFFTIRRLENSYYIFSKNLLMTKKIAVHIAYISTETFKPSQNVQSDFTLVPQIRWYHTATKSMTRTTTTYKHVWLACTPASEPVFQNMSTPECLLLLYPEVWIRYLLSWVNDGFIEFVLKTTGQRYEDLCTMVGSFHKCQHVNVVKY